MEELLEAVVSLLSVPRIYNEGQLPLQKSELAADIHLLKFQSLQNKVLRTTGNFPRLTPVRDLHTAFNLPNVHDYITKLCREHAEVLQNHENEYIRSTGQGEARHRKYNKLKLGAC
jgi:hypothetical protein